MSLRSEVIRILNEVFSNSKKISGLPAASALSGTEQVELNQSGTSVRTTTQAIANLGGGGGGSITDGIGTTANGTAVDLGSATPITSAVSLPIGVGGSVSITNPNGAEMNVGSSVIARTTDVILQFDGNANTVVLTDSRATPVGIEYGADYSASYTNRSLVDKEYVDNSAGGGGVQSVTGDGVDNTDPDNPVLSFPTPGDIGAEVAGAAAVVAGNLAAHIADATDAHAGSAITNTPAGNISATTVQAAINELDTEKISSALTLNSHWIGNSSNVATAYPLYYVTPEQYGAVGDGSTDDSTAINNAIASGLPVRFGNKNYRIATTLTTTDDTYLFGGGTDSIISVASNISIITIGGINGTIENIQLLGSGSGAAQNGITAVGNGSFNLYRYGTKVVNVFFNDLGNAGMYTINTIGNSSGSEHQGTYYAVNCRALSCAVGYLMDTRGEYNTFSNCLADNCPVGVRFNGGNNAWTGGNVVDCTIGVFIGSGTNDGHGVISGGRINHTNITCTSTATGYAFVGVEIVATSISLTSCTDIRFYNCDIASSPITSTSAVGTIFFGNCFRTTPTITVASGNNPVFVFNTFPAASTVHSLILNTVQGGISQTQQGPTSPNTFTSTWTTTASAQYSHQWNGTITLRATASDVFNAAIYDVNITATAANQQAYLLNLNPSATLSTGGQSGAAVGALRVRGKIRMIGLNSSGAITGASGLTYENSAGAIGFQFSDDLIYRGGNAGSPWQFTSTSDGLVQNNNGNGFLMTTGAIGANFGATSTGAGTANSHAIGVNGGSSISSGALSWAGIRIIPTHNQTGTATGDILAIDYEPTLTAVLGNHYFIRNRSITANSSFAMTAAPTAKIHIGASTTAAGTAQIKLAEGTGQTTPEDGTINYVNNNLEFVETSTVYILAKTLTATATLNFDLTAVNYQDLNMTVTGAVDGDAVSIGVPNGAVVADVTYFGWVSGANTVTIRCSRVGGGGAADPASGTFRASVIKY